MDKKVPGRGNVKKPRGENLLQPGQRFLGSVGDGWDLVGLQERFRGKKVNSDIQSCTYLPKGIKRNIR